MRTDWFLRPRVIEEFPLPSCSTEASDVHAYGVSGMRQGLPSQASHSGSSDVIHTVAQSMLQVLEQVPHCLRGIA